MKRHIHFGNYPNEYYTRTIWHRFRCFQKNIERKHRLTDSAAERAAIMNTAEYGCIGKEIVSKFITEHLGRGFFDNHSKERSLYG
jgi:hypothetical protein